MEEQESRDEERIEQAPEIPFEDVEKMVDEALALTPAREYNIPVSPFCTAVVGAQHIIDIFSGSRVNQMGGCCGNRKNCQGLYLGKSSGKK